MSGRVRPLLTAYRPFAIPFVFLFLGPSDSIFVCFCGREDRAGLALSGYRSAASESRLQAVDSTHQAPTARTVIIP